MRFCPFPPFPVVHNFIIVWNCVVLLLLLFCRNAVAHALSRFVLTANYLQYRSRSFFVDTIAYCVLLNFHFVRSASDLHSTWLVAPTLLYQWRLLSPFRLITFAHMTSLDWILLHFHGWGFVVRSVSAALPVGNFLYILFLQSRSDRRKIIAPVSLISNAVFSICLGRLPSDCLLKPFLSSLFRKISNVSWIEIYISGFFFYLLCSTRL